MQRWREGRIRPSHVALIVLTLATIVLTVLAYQKQYGGSTASAAAQVPSVPTPPSVAFVADGWTSGAPPGGLGPTNYTALLAAREGWRVTNPAVYGVGYVAGGGLAAQVPKVVDARPELVVVSGGRADSEEDPATVRDAAARLYGDLRTRLPQARIVVIGPMWLGEDAPDRMLEVRDAIRDAATAARLPFVDPVADRWFNGRDADGVTPDDENLTDRGHQRLAELVRDALRRTGPLPG